MDSRVKRDIKEVFLDSLKMTVLVCGIVFGFLLYAFIGFWWFIPMAITMNMWWLLGLVWTLIWITFAGMMVAQLWEIYG